MSSVNAILGSNADGPSRAGSGAVLVFAKGDELYGQGEATDLFYRLRRGVVRTTHLLPDGRRQIGDFYYPGDTVGVELGRAHRFSGEAVTECEVQAIRREGSAAYARGEIERIIQEATRAELDRAQLHMLLLGQTTAAERMARFLEAMAARTPGERVSLPMSRQDMADYLGLTIETVSRILGRLQALNLVRLCATRQYRVEQPGALHTLASA